MLYSELHGQDDYVVLEYSKHYERSIIYETLIQYRLNMVYSVRIDGPNILACATLRSVYCSAHT